jgi:hypothetical protein
MKFPVFNQLAGNFGISETSSQLTPPSSEESGANHGCGPGDATIVERVARRICLLSLMRPAALRRLASPRYGCGLRGQICLGRTKATELASS